MDDYVPRAVSTASNLNLNPNSTSPDPAQRTSTTPSSAAKSTNITTTTATESTTTTADVDKLARLKLDRYVALHPLALLSISDAVTRRVMRDRDEQAPLAGLLVGERSFKKPVEIEIAFECKTRVLDQQSGSEDDGKEAVEKTGRLFNDGHTADRIADFMEVFNHPSRQLVGMFAIAPSSGPLPYHKAVLVLLQRRAQIPDPILLLFHPDLAMQVKRGETIGRLPVSLYKLEKKAGAGESVQEVGVGPTGAGMGEGGAALSSAKNDALDAVLGGDDDDDDRDDDGKDGDNDEEENDGINPPSKPRKGLIQKEMSMGFEWRADEELSPGEADAYEWVPVGYSIVATDSEQVSVSCVSSAPPHGNISSMKRSSSRGKAPSNAGGSRGGGATSGTAGFDLGDFDDVKGPRTRARIAAISTSKSESAAARKGVSSGQAGGAKPESLDPGLMDVDPPEDEHQSPARAEAGASKRQREESGQSASKEATSRLLGAGGNLTSGEEAEIHSLSTKLHALRMLKSRVAILQQFLDSEVAKLTPEQLRTAGGDSKEDDSAMVDVSTGDAVTSEQSSATDTTQPSTLKDLPASTTPPSHSDATTSPQTATERRKIARSIANLALSTLPLVACPHPARFEAELSEIGMGNLMTQLVGKLVDGNVLLMGSSVLASAVVNAGGDAGGNAGAATGAGAGASAGGEPGRRRGSRGAIGSGSGTARVRGRRGSAASSRAMMME